MWRNSKNGYGLWSIFMHWLSAVMVTTMFVCGVWMVDLSFYDPWYKAAPAYHKSVGLILSLIVVLRLVLNTMQRKPQQLGGVWEKRLAGISHRLFYLLLASLFLSGYLISTADGRGIDVFDWFVLPSLGEWFDNQEDIAGIAHQWLAYCLIVMVVLHALAAVKHHVVNKDKTLIRMFKPTNLKEENP
ncbi:MAG: cytochrome b [Paraglaciecola sp.]|nr:cytochrome b [Paraglaciecola sp.]NCT49145.1 cytochrome b [Paraglaciecola sp.]